MSTLYGGADPVLLRWEKGAFTNSSVIDRYMWWDEGKRLFGPFATNVPAIATIKGQRWYQSEAAATNDLADFGSWTVRGTGTLTGSQADPIGGTGAYQADVDSSSDDVYYQYSGGTAAATISPSIFIKRMGATGSLRITSRTTSANGLMDVDLSMLSDGWERITTAHPAVTVTNPWVNDGSGIGGMRLFAASGGPLSVLVWRPQVEEAVHPSSPIQPATTREDDSMTFTAAQVPAVMRDGKWKFDIMPLHSSADDYYTAPTAAATRLFDWGTGGVEHFTVRWQSLERILARDNNTSTNYVQCASLTWDRQQQMAVKLDTVAGAMTIEGATTGNGTVTDTSWSGVIPSSHDLVVGRRFLNVTKHPNTWIAEPRRWA